MIISKLREQIELVSKGNTDPAKFALKNNTRLLFSVIAALVLIASLIGTFFVLKEEKVIDKQVLYSYSVTADSNYNINLVPNELFLEGWLPADSLISLHLLDNLHVNFSANFIGDKEAQISGTYEVKSIVRGIHGSGDKRKIIYERSFPIVGPKPITAGTRNASVKETAFISLSPYNQFAENAKIILDAKPTSEIIIQFSGTFVAETVNGQVKEPFKYELIIPASTDLFTISKPAAYSKTGEQSTTAERVLPKNIKALVSLIFLIILAILIILGLIFLVRPLTSEELYEYSLKEALRKYGSRIAVLSSMPSALSDCKEFIIENLESLVRVADEHKCPIYYVKNEDGLPHDGLLFVLFENHFYRYRFNKNVNKIEG